MTEDDVNTEKKFKKIIEQHRENSLYPDPILKCYIGNGNNSELIETILTSIGYERQIEKIDDYKFKWVQCNGNVNWNSFKDGEQMVNHIQGEDYFTTKLQLYQSLQTYEKITTNMQKFPSFFLSLNQFVPQTFKLDEKYDREAFINTHQPGDLWICKPNGLNQGKGIYLVRDIEDIKEKYPDQESNEKRKQSLVKLNKRILQRYIMNPLLIHGKKFDIRCYMLISSVKPLIVLYHSGYIRLSMFDFDANDLNLLTHLTNQYMQKKDPKYYDVKEDTAWTMEQFNDYVNRNLIESKQLEKDWVLNILPKIIQRIMLNVIESIRMRLKRRVGCFGLYGYDFMIDEDMKVWLIEINVNPALTTNTQTLIEAIPPVVKESILISIECFDKIRHNQKLFPLKSLKGFKCIYNELERKGSLAYIEQKRARSSSPTQRKLLPQIPSSSSSSSTVKTNPIKIKEQPTSPYQTTTKSIISYSLRQSEDRLRETLITPKRSTLVDPLVIKYQTIQRYRTNFEILKPATIIAEEWKNLDQTQKNRLAIGENNSKCAENRFSMKTSKTTRSLTPLSNNTNCPRSAANIQQLNQNQDLTPALTKSALIYQLIRSRLQANLAKSLFENKNKLNQQMNTTV